MNNKFTSSETENARFNCILNLIKIFEMIFIYSKTDFIFYVLKNKQPE